MVGLSKPDEMQKNGSPGGKQPNHQHSRAAGSPQQGESERNGSGSASQPGEGVEAGPVFESGVVDFLEKERPPLEAVRLMADILDEPSNFGLVLESGVPDVDPEEIAERNEVQESAIADLAEAVDMLAEKVEDDTGTRVRLDPDAFGDIYTPSHVE